MKRLLLLALLSGNFCEAFAKDSDWKICKTEATLFDQPNEKMLINIYEHRDGAGRKADLTFIYGGNVLKGNLNTSEITEGAVKLTGDKSTFKGNAVIDYSAQSISLSGKLTINKIATNLNATFECETL